MNCSLQATEQISNLGYEPRFDNHPRPASILSFNKSNFAFIAGYRPAMMGIDKAELALPGNLVDFSPGMATIFRHVDLLPEHPSYARTEEV
jgi:hypothetical protein